MIPTGIAAVKRRGLHGVFGYVLASAQEQIKEFVSSEIVSFYDVPCLSVGIIGSLVAHSVWWICKNCPRLLVFSEELLQVSSTASTEEYMFPEPVDVPWFHNNVTLVVQWWHIVLDCILVFAFVWEYKVYFIKIKPHIENWQVHVEDVVFTEKLPNEVV